MFLAFLNPNLKTIDMDLKKSIEANLEKRKKSFLAIGLLFSLATVLAAFEYRTIETQSNPASGLPMFDDDTETAIVTIPKPPPPPLPIKRTPTEIVLVDDINEEDFVDFLTDDIDFDDEIEYIVEEDLPEEVIVPEKIPTLVDDMPEFYGGLQSMYKYISSNINYPPNAMQMGRQGKVHISFVVEKDGTISSVVLLRGIGNECDEEALRVVKQMPKWKPGRQRGKLVRVQFHLPISFKLR